MPQINNIRFRQKKRVQLVKFVVQIHFSKILKRQIE